MSSSSLRPPACPPAHTQARTSTRKQGQAPLRRRQISGAGLKVMMMIHDAHARLAPRGACARRLRQVGATGARWPRSPASGHARGLCVVPLCPRSDVGGRPPSRAPCPSPGRTHGPRLAVGSPLPGCSDVRRASRTVTAGMHGPCRCCLSLVACCCCQRNLDGASVVRRLSDVGAGTGAGTGAGAGGASCFVM